MQKGFHRWPRDRVEPAVVVAYAPRPIWLPCKDYRGTSLLRGGGKDRPAPFSRNLTRRQFRHSRGRISTSPVGSSILTTPYLAGRQSGSRNFAALARPARIALASPRTCCFSASVNGGYCHLVLCAPCRRCVPRPAVRVSCRHSAPARSSRAQHRSYHPTSTSLAHLCSSGNDP